jgi:hypothetical protein
MAIGTRWKGIGMRRALALVRVLLVPGFALIIGTAASTAWAEADADDACCGRGPAVQLPATKFFIEHNATDEDTGGSVRMSAPREG